MWRVSQETELERMPGCGGQRLKVRIKRARHNLTESSSLAAVPFFKKKCFFVQDLCSELQEHRTA